jgi:hypothetical protein
MFLYARPSVDAVGETIAKAAAERRSKVSFDIEPHGDQVNLTVIHDDSEPTARCCR